MRKVKLLDFVSKYVDSDFVVWCPTFNNELFDRDEIFETQIVKDPDSVCVFDYFLVDSICVNGVIQINCHFNTRSYIKHAKELQRQAALETYYPQTLLDLYGDDDE